MLLELIQQLETGKKLSILDAFIHTLGFNTIKILPIVIVWTVVWFILLIIQALLSKSKRREKESLSAENAAKTLAGYGNFSLSKSFFNALQKGIRMVVFLILPAIAWENLDFLLAVKRGLSIFRTHLSVFVTGFLFTSLAAALIFIPPIILFYISDEMKITFPEWVWYLTTTYITFAWSYSIYLEQMFTAELYLWHLKWEDVPKPSVLDNIPDLINKN